jgi:hypothetical protein
VRPAERATFDRLHRLIDRRTVTPFSKMSWPNFSLPVSRDLRREQRSSSAARRRFDRTVRARRRAHRAARRTRRAEPTGFEPVEDAGTFIVSFPNCGVHGHRAIDAALRQSP